MLDACALLHIADPEEFYRLAPHIQELWVEHVTNEWTGAYLTQPGKGGGQSSADAMRIQCEAIERAQGGV